MTKSKDLPYRVSTKAQAYGEAYTAWDIPMQRNPEPVVPAVLLLDVGATDLRNAAVLGRKGRLARKTRKLGYAPYARQAERARKPLPLTARLILMRVYFGAQLPVE